MNARGPGLALVILVGAASGRAQEFEIVRQFVPSGGQPFAKLVAGSDGDVYGTTSAGGDFNRGAIFRLVPAGAGEFQYQQLYSFHGPEGSFPQGLTRGADSRLYGVTGNGGSSGAGTAFVFDRSASFAVLHDFEVNPGIDDYGPSPLTQASDGQFYGVTFRGGAHGRGTFFRLSPSGDFAALHDFDGSDGEGPIGALIQASDGYLYGATRYGGAAALGAVAGAAGIRPKGIPDPGDGTIFRSDLAGNVTSIHSFAGGEGRYPNGDLVEGLDGNLYGTNGDGGTASVGTVYRCSKSGTVTVLHSFGAPGDGAYPSAGLTRGGDGVLYGVTGGGGPTSGGVVFRMTTAGDFTTIASFPGGDPAQPSSPSAGVTLASDGSLLGTTPLGGPADVGTVFRVPLPDTGFSVLHEFGTKAVALSPASMLVETPDGTLWGTAGGGSFDAGTIYRLSGGPLLAHEFTGSDGAGPGELLAPSDGILYGTTSSQGPNGSGTIFRLDPSETLTTIHAFAGADGASPDGGLMQATDGDFYGTAAEGGVHGGGTMFRISGSGTFTKLHDFLANAVPEEPRGRLLQASDGKLYGTTIGFRGTLYQSDLDGNLSTLHEFLVPDGEGPPAGVIQASDGNLYGTCRYWGDDQESLGTVYRFELPATYSVIHTFSGQGRTRGGVVQASDTRLYGTTTGELSGTRGSVFVLDIDGGNFATLHDFQGGEGDGEEPAAGLFAASDGMLYGTTRSGGWSFAGLVYRLDLVGEPPSVAAVTPTSGSHRGGTPLTVTGDHYRADTTGSAGAGAFRALRLFDTHTLFAVSPPLAPGTLNDVVVINRDSQSARLPAAFFADFVDAPANSRFHAEIETILRAGITAGCGDGNYCTDASASRAQMAVLLLKLEHGPAYAPPPCTGAFLDVVCPSLFADWIEQFAVEEITAGCGDGNYCPQDPVTREQSAVLILKAEHGAKYVPPACTGLFVDVPCTSPFAVWIEQLLAEGITDGCGNGYYCPSLPTTRGQMAAFLTRALALP